MNRPRLILGMCILIFIVVRITAYGPLGYSVSTQDTASYINASKIPFFTSDFFRSHRPPAMALFYKLLIPQSGYEITALSWPYWNLTPSPAIQPGLQRITLAQQLLSIGVWALLAVVLARRLVNPGHKILAALLVLAFGSSPSISEWDMVMMSESLSMSLFVVLLAISIELIPKLVISPLTLNMFDKVRFATWVFVLSLWVFVRDDNAYLIIAFFMLCIFLLGLRRVRRAMDGASRSGLIFVGALFAAIFLIHSVNLHQSMRWIEEFYHVLHRNVFPYPERLAFFRGKGMPISRELLEQPYNPDVSYDFYKRFIDNPQLRAWSARNGLRTYMEFLLLNPGWTLEYFLYGLDDAFSLNRQIYFNLDEKTNVMYDLGDMLNPESVTVIWVVLAELAIFGLVATKSMQRGAIGLFIFFCALIAGEFLVAFVVIHGDTGALPRHAIGAVMPLRLMLWIFPPLILDAHGLQVGARVAIG